eukprot:243044_1
MNGIRTSKINGSPAFEYVPTVDSPHVIVPGWVGEGVVGFAVIRALIHIMSKVASDETYMTWIVSAERYTHKYYRKIVKNAEELRSVICSSIKSGLLQSRIGVISFVLSVILTRSLPVILEEVDDKSQSLILTEIGHC